MKMRGVRSSEFRVPGSERGCHVELGGMRKGFALKGPDIQAQGRAYKVDRIAIASVRRIALAILDLEWSLAWGILRAYTSSWHY